MILRYYKIGTRNWIKRSIRDYFINYYKQKLKLVEEILLVCIDLNLW